MLLDNKTKKRAMKNKPVLPKLDLELAKEGTKLEPKEEGNSSIKELLQKQVCHEFGNERLYISMSLWCEEKGYIETAKFFSEHSLEERKHGMDFINYMNKRKMTVKPPCDQEIEREFENLEVLLKTALKQEIKTSNMIKELHQEALKTSDMALTIASKYLCEQVEEEQLFISLINLFNLCEGTKIDFEMEVNLIKKKDKYKIGTL